MLDIFNDDAYGVRTLTDAINKDPFEPMQIGSMGVFAERGVPTTQISVEEKDGVLDLLPYRPRGGVETELVVKKGTLRPFTIPHIPTGATIMAEEVQGVRSFGTENALRAVADVVAQRRADIARNLDVTVEYQRVGAIKGSILDADGSTEVLNLFTAFNVSQESEIAFDLSSSTLGALMKKCNAAVRLMATNAGALRVRRVRAICGAQFWDDFTTNAEVRDSYQRWQDGEFLRTGNVFTGFTWGGITWEEYRGSVNGVDFVHTDKCHLFPDAPGLFVTYYAPGPSMEMVNTLGLPRYLQLLRDPSGRNEWVRLWGQTNPLSLCLRPKLLMKGKRGA